MIEHELRRVFDSNLFAAVFLSERMQCESRDLENPSTVHVTVSAGQNPSAIHVTVSAGQVTV